MTHIVKVIQSESFKNEISCLNKNKPLSSKSPILSLTPFIDKNGILRVGGRLSQSKMNYDARHQILLPAKHHFTTLVFKHFHILNCHAGPQLLHSIVRQRFWPLSGKIAAKRCVNTCIACFRNKPKIAQQLMGQLPSERITCARPFTTTGVDYCGPFLVKENRKRKSPTIKVYIAVFVCFVTKCVHIEIVSDLTTKEFEECLKRFIFRRGCPQTIWSDNASTFIGAKNDLKAVFKFLKEKSNVDSIINFCSLQEIKWEFIPPRSPNFGGIWESSVKSLKTHLKRVLMNQTLLKDELNTLVIQIEGILNSRPITPLSTDPSDPQPLTPAHFLCGGPIVAPADIRLSDKPTNQISNWQKVTKMLQSYWERFSLEFLHTMQQKTKWKQQSPNLKVNDVVLVVDEQLPPTHWLLGIINDVTKGSDGKIRVVNVKTKNGIFSRAISKICKLPLDD